MTKPFTDNPAKQAVREKWDTPVLRYLHRKYGVRYRYMGLPGTDLIDVRLWRDMIDEVIAFEPPDRSPDRRRSIVELRRNLKIMGVPGVAYFGNLEEVVTLGRDYDGQDYAQKRVVTLYNLDFCNEIASAIETREQGKRILRFEALRQVFRDQGECYRRVGGPNYFVFMLTIRNQIDAKKIRGFLNTQLLAEAKEFRDECELIKPLPAQGPLIGSHPWALKAFLFNLIGQYFANPNISAVFFPLVLYKGTKVMSTEGLIESPMLHWLILCSFASAERQAPEIFPSSFLRRSSVVVRNGSLTWTPQTGETAGGAGPPDCVRWLTDFGAQFLQSLPKS